MEDIKEEDHYKIEMNGIDEELNFT